MEMKFKFSISIINIICLVDVENSALFFKMKYGNGETLLKLCKSTSKVFRWFFYKVN